MILYNNRKLEFGKFPNGESNLRKIKPDPQGVINVVTLKYEDDSDLFHLLLLKEHLDELRLAGWLQLRITYVPYSRMDRENESYVFSLKTFAKFINDMNWQSVIIYEPHSDVTPALFDRVRVIPVTGSLGMERVINAVVGKLEGAPYYQLFYPDAGALKRYGEYFKTGNWLMGLKVRDFETGRIKDMDVVGKQEQDTVVMVDDLCSKGGTFVMAAEQLKAMGFKNIVLAVAHCEQTIFKGEIFETDLIGKVITTDSILERGQSVYQKRLEIIPLTDFGV